MKLRNKKTGEIRELPDGFFCGDSLKKICEEWEDALEEPKERHYYIEPRGQVIKLEFGDDIDELKEELLEIGNYFSSREEAEKAVEKLKAWKRLKDKGIKAFSSEICGDDFVVKFKLTNHVDYSQSIDDFDCIFDLGGEE